ncbi:alpha-mannosidase [Brachybacterium hainanense]|uniref:Alpha-mannosidase n=1 Tax=Brachybacterium hainanense TaxID=1541174 RepID=A0ABV6R8F8_9MICO
MFDDSTRILARARRALRERIIPASHRILGDLAVSAWDVPGDGEPVPAAQVPADAFAPVVLPHPWGRAWATTWFRLEGTVPRVGEGEVPLLDVDLGFKDDWPGNQCEGLLLTEDLRVLKAINSRNRTARVDGAAGERIALLIEAAANPDMMEDGTTPTELGDRLTAPADPRYTLRHARWTVRVREVWDLQHDLEVLVDLASVLPEDSVRRARILAALEDALDALDLHDVPGTAARAREALAPALAARADASALQITTIGHAHIDSAWLWPVRETIRKVGRTFSNVLALMEEYPELTFTATSAQQYAWLQEHSPDTFARVREAVAGGRWAPSGGMWVESDVMMPGGEALVRQLAYGTRYFERELGVRSRTLWLPDSFGYSAALPQIARQMGMEGFLTQKISWNRTNQHPHSTFWWEGIDGTRIFTHFPPVNCYDSMLTAQEIRDAERNFREKGRARHQVIPFGYGDGGGGPTADMAEKARRRADLEGSPQLRMGTPDAFFDAARAEYAQAAPVHRGELYLEFHRGIFTSQLEMKQGNRRAEHALRTLELVWSLVTARGLGRIDQEAVDRLWERTLLLQFHDILPGSSIAWVHREAREDHAAILARAEELVAEGLALLARTDGDAEKGAENGTADTRGPDAPQPTAETGPSLLNPGPHERYEVLEVDGEPRLVEIEGSSLVPLADALREVEDPVVLDLSADGRAAVLDNGLLRAEIAADGTLARIVDLVRGREVLAPGTRGHELQLFEDVPNEFDAWDIDRHYRGSSRGTAVPGPQGLRVRTRCAARIVLETDLLLDGSPALLSIGLDAGSSRLDFGLDVDWRSRETLLKAAFPLAVHASSTVAETQFGHVTRPLHENTSWEFAKFEMPMHRWVLAAEPGYGAALVVDSTYGYDALPLDAAEGPGSSAGTLLRLSLMRSPNWPDPRADLSRRSLRYSLLVGADPVSAAQTGYALNLPLRLTGAAPAAGAARIEDAGVHLEAILPAHDGSGDLILRLYEGRGARCRTRLHLDVPAVRVREVDPLDADLPRPGIDRMLDPVAGERSVDLDLRPFQILSLRLTLENTP